MLGLYVFGLSGMVGKDWPLELYLDASVSDAAYKLNFWFVSLLRNLAQLVPKHASIRDRGIEEEKVLPRGLSNPKLALTNIDVQMT